MKKILLIKTSKSEKTKDNEIKKIPITKTVNHKNQKKLKSREEQKFEKYFQKIEDPKREKEINRALPPQATPLEKTKYEICKKMLGYQLKNNLTDKEITKKIDLSQAEVEEILFCEIEKFTLDRLLTYANRLFSPNEIEVIVEEKVHH